MKLRSNGAAAHGNDVLGVRHLVVNLAQRRGHLVGQGPGNNHDVRLPRRRAENHTEPLHVVPGSRGVHHLNSAAGQAEGHGPKRSLPRPVDQIVDAGHSILHRVIDGDRAGPAQHFLDAVEAGQLREGRERCTSNEGGQGGHVEQGPEGAGRRRALGEREGAKYRRNGRDRGRGRGRWTVQGPWSLAASPFAFPLSYKNDD